MKKLISILLCMILIATSAVCISPVASAASGADIPVIHVSGANAQITRINDEGVKETVYPLQIPDGYIEEKAEEFLPIFARAFFTQQWDEFSETLVDILVPIFEPIALDGNGEVTDGSRADWTWSVETLRDKKNADGKYDPTAYQFYYDFRLDPMVIADTLHQYIEDVMTVTGAEKVALYGRCLGSNIVAAYMFKYNGEHVQEVIHYASSVYGATQCSKAFTGELFIHADGVERFIYDFDLGLDEQYNGLLQSFVTLFNKTYGLDVTCWAINNVAEDIYLDIFPEIVRSGYGTFPSYWGMVSIEDYQRARETVFYGVDEADYAGLIEKIEYYRNNVQLKFEENAAAQAEQGIEFSNIVKYGYQLLPLTENSGELADRTVTVRESSFGATVSLCEETLSDEYLSQADPRYISPDRQIDASTCFSPDTTWFIKNMLHDYFPPCVNALVSEIVNNDNFTVFSNPEFTQYLIFDDETQTISPMTAENCNEHDRWNVTYFEALRRFFMSLFEIIRISLFS